MCSQSLCAACVNCIDKYACTCKAYPKGIPSDAFCMRDTDIHYGDPSVPLPDVKCPNGYRFEFDKEHLEDVRYCFRMGLE